MNRKILTFLLFISSALTINAQTINGIVKAQKSDGGVEPLAFASIYWLEGKISLESNEKGEFSFNKKGTGTVSLIATYVGYTKDTLLLKNGEVKAELLLKEQNELNAARVVGKQEGNFLSKITPVKTEVITAAGLCKMACCNLRSSC